MKELERVEVGYINTPLEFMPNLTKYFSKGNLYVKRDDLTGLALGGNKTRKLDYIVKYALDNGYTTLLTHGASQTNHGRLTIAAAAKFGLKSILVIDEKKPVKTMGNLILDKMMGAELLFVENDGMSEEEFDKYKSEQVESKIEEYEKKDEKVLEIPVGGSSALGAYGYFMCIKEIMEQIEQQSIKVDHLVCAHGSMGTYAGLWLGAKYFNAPFDIIGVPISPTPHPLQECHDLVNDLAKLCEIEVECKIEDFIVVGGLEDNKYAVPAYAKSNENTRKAMCLMAQQEAIITDPCYTGKVVDGMFDLIQQEIIPASDNVLFLHTGGSPALFASPHVEDMEEEFLK